MDRQPRTREEWLEPDWGYKFYDTPTDPSEDDWLYVDVRAHERNWFSLWIVRMGEIDDPFVQTEGKALEGQGPTRGGEDVWISWLRWLLVGLLDRDPRLSVYVLLREYAFHYPRQCGVTVLREEDYIPDEWKEQRG